MNGRFGAWDLKPGVIQSIAQCPTSEYSVVTVNLCNRGNETDFIKLAITIDESDFENNPSFIESGIELPAKGVLERSGVIIPAESFLTVQSEYGMVSAVVTGVSNGNAVTRPDIVEVSDTTAPTWITPQNIPQTVRSDVSADIQLETNDNSNQEYEVISGEFVPGLTLTKFGKINGFCDPFAENKTYTFTVEATDPFGNSATREFNLTKVNAISASGGTKRFINVGNIDYTVHAFTSTSSNMTFDVDTPGFVDILVVGGGGGTTNQDGSAGAGAGGLVLATGVHLTRGSYTVTVGDGGEGQDNADDSERGRSGVDSQFDNILLGRGGGGGGGKSSTGRRGGSGGGNGQNASGTPGEARQPGTNTLSSGTLVFDAGNDGAPDRNNNSGGGGGGAGEAGGFTGDNTVGGTGLDLSAYFGSDFGENGYFAGGGGGGDNGGGGDLTPGLGGGGTGGTEGASRAGKTNTGGGAGGSNNDFNGANGGSGIVLVRYSPQ